MAMFSRTKSKAKRANEQEVLKAAVQETITMPDDAPQRGRKGKEAVRPSQHDYASAKLPIPGPPQPPRPFQYAPDGTGLAHNRNDSFEGSDYLTALSSKQDHCDTTSSSDSGYSSAGPQSRSISRTPTVQREMGCFQISNRSMTQLSLGGESAREPVLSARPSLQNDAIDRDSVHTPKTVESRFLNPSRSLQGMRSYFRPEHEAETPLALPNQHRYHDARYQRQFQQSVPIRPASVSPQASRSMYGRISRPPPQSSSSSSGAALQSSRSAYALRSLAAVPSSSRLPYDWSNQIPSNLDQQLQASHLQARSSASLPPQKPLARTESRQKESTPPLSILDGLKVNKRGLILDEEGGPIGELYEGDIIDCVREKADAHGAVRDEYGQVVGRVRTLPKKTAEPMLRSESSKVEKLHGFPLPPVSATSLAAKSPRSDDAHSETPDQLAQTQRIMTAQKGGPSSISRVRSSLRRRGSVEQNDQPTATPHGLAFIPHEKDHEQISSQHGTSAPPQRLHVRSESLPSVPESHSTAAEIESSDDGSLSSEESRQDSADDGILIGKRVCANSSARTEPRRRRYPVSSHARSVSEPVILTTALPPVPTGGKRPPEMSKKTSSATTPTHSQRSGFATPPTNRVQSLPLPTFPGKGLSGGSPKNGPSARRLTTSASPMSSPLGMASPNTPSFGPGIPRTIPLVRSPLSSSQGTRSFSLKVLTMAGSHH